MLSSHLLGGATSGACNCQDWFKQKFFPEGTTYKEIESRLSHTRDTPVFLPFLFGERCPGWNEKRTGGFLCVRPELGKTVEPNMEVHKTYIKKFQKYLELYKK
ncbi:hypothetical protein HRQ91_10895 [Treponema parvum]|uniref:Uncharacterized protein n=1 Tax=Treponema parvum TaxID=138851 RepID=A0A975IG79_9SPIR|nr:hypothetical protein [Treponema parvum]QTQ14924.1 hypothetical protein HRQ91_10895 [Treponema parvum]